MGLKKKELQKLTTSNSKYTLEDSKPSEEDKDLDVIPFLMNHVIKRSKNIDLVGPPGCGKSCLVETITMKYGVQFFGKPDELKDAQFVVFDDIKRLLDREFQEQRVSVRYTDTKLKNSMTRIVLHS